MALKIAICEREQSVGEIARHSFKLEGPLAVLSIGGACYGADGNLGIKMTLINAANPAARIDIGDVTTPTNGAGAVHNFALAGSYKRLEIGPQLIPAASYRLEISALPGTGMNDNNKFAVYILDGLPV